MYFHKAQGFIYNLLRNTSFEKLHDSPGYKFFCFSNFFPYSKTVKSGEEKFFLVSSPNNAFIDALFGKLSSIKDKQLPVFVGEMGFSLNEVKKVASKVKRDCWIDTATPVTLRIPAYNYARYGLTQVQYRNGAFWRSEHSFEAFVKQVEENLFKKFQEFYNLDLQAEPLIESFKFKKSVSNRAIINGREQPIIGSVWNLKPMLHTGLQQKIWRFALDTGIGERNPLGFGFVNVVKNGQS